MCKLHSLKVYSLISFDKYVESSNHHHNFYHPESSPLPPLQEISPYLQPLTSSDLISDPKFLPFPEYRMNRIMHCVAFCAWPLSFSTVSVRFIHVVACIK